MLIFHPVGGHTARALLSKHALLAPRIRQRDPRIAGLKSLHAQQMPKRRFARGWDTVNEVEWAIAGLVIILLFASSTSTRRAERRKSLIIAEDIAHQPVRGRLRQRKTAAGKLL